METEKANAVLEAKDILRILPHRYPFLLIDRVLEIEEGKRIVALKNVTMNEQCFTGHFPDNPIMPGVLIIEMMAQAAGVILLLTEEHKGKLAYLAGIEKARFRKPVLPGDSVILEAQLIKARSTMGWMKTVAKVGEHIVCEAELAFAVVARDNVAG